MPQLGETVTEGTVASWSKAVGDKIEPGDILFEVETDKTSMEIPATVAGVLSEIKVEAGTLVEVGVVVAVITEAGAAAIAPAAPVAVAATAKPADAPTTAPAPERDPHRAVVTPDKNFGAAHLANGTEVTPLARRLAGEAGVAIDQLNGSGPGGRIVARDVSAGRSAAPTRAAPVNLAAYNKVPHDVVKVDAMRKTIARRLVESKQTVPHFYLSVDVLLDPLNALRAATNAAQPAGTAQKLSVNDFVIKALGVALTRVPAANAIWADDKLLQFKRADIGVAVAIDGGLITPVVREVDAKNIFEISAEMKTLAARARERALLPDEYAGGSISISNLGMFGVREFSAIINPPHAAILAVGAAVRVAQEAADGAVRFGSQMTVSLSCDHRVIDGAVGAQLLAAFKAAIEDPAALLM